MKVQLPPDLLALFSDLGLVGDPGLLQQVSLQTKTGR